MKRSVIALATIMAVMPAGAWELDSTETKKGWNHVAFQTDKEGSVELQFYCDHLYPDDIQMLVFTNQDALAGDSALPQVAVKTIVDDHAFEDLDGFYDDVDGERTLVVDTLKEQRLREVIALAEHASKPLQIFHGDDSHRFGAEGLGDVLARFMDRCSQHDE